MMEATSAPGYRNLEEGECSSSDEENMLPMARDASTLQSNSAFGSSSNFEMMKNNPRIPQIVIHSDDDEYDSDEDDYSTASKKISKISHASNPSEQVFVNPLLSKPKESTSNSKSNRRKNNIWGSVLAEQSLSHDIKFFSVEESQPDTKYRDVESYDYTIAKDDDRPFFEPENVTAEGKEDLFDNVVDLEKEVNLHERRKRKRPIKERLGTKISKSTQLNCSYVLESKEVPETVTKIVDALEESNVSLFCRIVKSIGNDKSLAILRKTEDVESAGGLMVNNGTRRRTAGGVYIQLLKSEPDIPKNTIDYIFEEQHQEWEKRKVELRKRKRAKRGKWRRAQAEKKASKLYMDVDRPDTPVPIDEDLSVLPQGDANADFDVTDLPERPATPEPKDDSSDGEFDDADDDADDDQEDISIAIAKAKAAILKKQRELSTQTEIDDAAENEIDDMAQS